MSYGILRDCLQEYQKAVKTAKTTYFSNLVSSNIHRPKVLFNVLDSVVNPRNTDPITPTPAHCNNFVNFFIDKISALRSVSPVAPSDSSEPHLYSVVFKQFEPITLEELSDVVKGLCPTNCPSDCIPSCLFKTVFNSTGSFILRLVHACFTSGCFPASLKHAIVQPLIKKPNLDPTVLSNFRPISKLSFLSKVLEKVMANQLLSFLEENNIFEKFQSGFRPRHSCETALLKVFNDICVTLDSGCAAMLMTLDLTAAFDTVDHRTLLSHLEQHVGIKGSALMLIKSYLTDRSFSVQLGSFSSIVAPLTCGVPQGSILGPLLFSLYMLPLGSIFRKHDISFHCSADDVQIYLPLQLTAKDPLNSLLACLADIKSWISQSQLILNENKTEVTAFGLPEGCLHSFDGQNLLALKITPYIKSLGVTFDSNLDFKKQINTVVKGSFHQIRILSKVKPYLSFNDLERVIHAFVSCRLDYCNSLYIGLDQSSLRRLQLVQNVAARLLTGAKKHNHITPVLASHPTGFPSTLGLILKCY